MQAQIRFGAWGGDGPTVSVPVKETERPLSGSTVTGYGKRLPTSYMVQYKGTWRRVRCTCYSNSGTLWARIDGTDCVVEIWR